MTQIMTALMIAAASLGTMSPPAQASQSTSQDGPRATEKRPIRRARGMLREGAFLADQPCTLRSLDHGMTAVLFDRNEKGQSAPPMILLPCAILMRIEQIHGSGGDDTHFFISGQVFVYGRRNYLLPTYYKIDSGNRHEPAPAGESPAATPDTEADPSVAALIDSLTIPDQPTPMLVDTTMDEAAGVSLLSDGSYLKPRQGRIITNSAGAPSFVVDNDADTSVGPTPDAGEVGPMPILPSRSRMLLETLLAENGADRVFLVSGRVFLYRGRNYLLPSMVQLQLDTSSGLTSAQ